MTRIEEDAHGDVEVPADRLWGAQTERAHHNFRIGVERYRWGSPVIRALGMLKKCAALSTMGSRRTISLKAYRENLTLREAAIQLGYLTSVEFDEWVNPEEMTHPLH